MNVPQLRFKGFSDEWKTIKLNEILATVTDYVANGSFKTLREHVHTSSKEDYAYMIRLQDYNNEWKGPWLYTTKKSYLFLKKSMLFESDIIISNVGSVGTVFKIPKLNKHATLAPNSILIRPKSCVDNNYLFYVLNNFYFQKSLHRKVTPGVQSKINKTDLKSIMICMPLNLKEQQKIGTFFSKLDDLITKQTHKVTLLKQLKQGYLQKLFPQAGQTTPQLRFKDNNGNNYPNWKKKRLSEISTRCTGNEGNINLPVLTISAKQGWLNQKERFNQIIAGNELKKYTLLHKGELSYNHGNSKFAKYGVIFMLNDYDKALVPKVYHSFKVNNDVNPKYIEYLSQGKLLDRYLMKMISSTARMDGLLNINYNDFTKLIIKLPTIKEQNKIVNLLLSFDKLINFETTKLNLLKRLKKGYLQKMFI